VEVGKEELVSLLQQGGMDANARRIWNHSDTPWFGENTTSAKNVQIKMEENDFVVSWPYALLPCHDGQEREHGLGCRRRRLRNVAVHVTLLALHVILLDKSVDIKCQ
jgi:hypothetical protein